MNPQEKMLSDISAVYELSLAIGTSLNLKENCVAFLKVLNQQKELTFSSIWIKNEDKYELIEGIPAVHIDETEMAENHFLLKKLGNAPFYSHCAKCGNDNDFKKLVQEKDISKGTYGVFKLGEIGFLKFYEQKRSKTYELIEMTQLLAVIEKLGVSLEGSIAHQVRKEAEEKIQKNEAHLRQIIDSALDAIISIDHRGVVTEWNKPAETIFEFTKEEAIGQPLHNLIIPKVHKQAHQNGMKRFLKTGHGPVLNHRIEINAVKKSGKEFPVELSITDVKLSLIHI